MKLLYPLIILFAFSFAFTQCLGDVNDDDAVDDNVQISDSIINTSIEYQKKKFNLSVGVGDSRNALSVLG